MVTRLSMTSMAKAIQLLWHRDVAVTGSWGQCPSATIAMVALLERVRVHVVVDDNPTTEALAHEGMLARVLDPLRGLPAAETEEQSGIAS